MPPPQCPERCLDSKVGPARSRIALVLAVPHRMEIRVETDELARRIADALRHHKEPFLSELVTRLAQKFGATSAKPAPADVSEGTVIMGIKTHALYSVSFVADRWEVSADNVRKKSEEELPRSEWKGGEIRYRGIDVLRYEGVDIEEHLDGVPSPLKDERGSRSPETPQPNVRPSPADQENGDERPYNSDLPALSGEDSAAD